MKQLFNFALIAVLLFGTQTFVKAQQISFIADVTQGCTPLVVNFTNTSTYDTAGVNFYWENWDVSAQINSYKDRKSVV